MADPITLAPSTAPPAGSLAQAGAKTSDKMEALRKAAVELEASFLSEMLKEAGFGEAREAFGGGIGEEQFSSFLRNEHAHAMAKAGGIGLAESLFQAMVKRMEDV
ncbi:rod-binding protein [Phaeovulum vinaykumarii]|uniref:Rod binding protein n=1 Tax=Phaeovulum vinaykumarii TaxID=407234 RepID=A0A1N7MC66_9RHOB|nr:Rod binding protein [Phaeovulum vinaykumarii]SOC10132.1 rod binding protein [Phaeovulum vinaykumarii]